MVIIWLVLGLLGLSRCASLWTPFDILSNFTPHLFAVLVGFTIGFLVPAGRVPVSLTISFFGLLVIGAYAHEANGYLTATAAPRAGERQLRIMTFNTQISNDDIDAIASEIRRLDSNVAVLIEFGQNKRRLLRMLAKDYPYFIDCGKSCQFAVLSQFPIKLVEQKSDWDGPWVIRASLGSDFSNLEIIGVHLTRPPMIEKQFRQMRVLTDYVRQIKGDVVVVGDFNATPFSHLLARFAKGTGLRRLTSLPSWPSYLTLPQFAIDHVFVSAEIRMVRRARIGRPAGSDHYPVALTLEVAESQ